MTRLIYLALNLVPAPLFFVGFILSMIMPASICGSWAHEMTVMWAVMTLAHLSPWLLWFQQRNLARDA